MPRLARPAMALAVLGVLAAVAVVALRGYFTPEAMIYFLSFKWCA